MDQGAWTFEGEVVRTGRYGAPITLVDAADFCLSTANGDIRRGTPHGLFLLDSRFLCQFELRVDGEVFHVDGLPMTLTLDRRAREPLTGLRVALVPG